MTRALLGVVLWSGVAFGYDLATPTFNVSCRTACQGGVRDCRRAGFSYGRCWHELRDRCLEGGSCAYGPPAGHLEFVGVPDPGHDGCGVGEAMVVGFDLLQRRRRLSGSVPALGLAVAGHLVSPDAYQVKAKAQDIGDGCTASLVLHVYGEVLGMVISDLRVTFQCGETACRSSYTGAMVRP